VFTPRDGIKGERSPIGVKIPRRSEVILKKMKKTGLWNMAARW
jgi:hypothetical protein